MTLFENKMALSLTPSSTIDLFHNNYLPQDFKGEVREKILEQGQDFLDSAMTYSLFDWMNENADDFINRIPEMAKVYLCVFILILRFLFHFLDISRQIFIHIKC